MDNVELGKRFLKEARELLEGGEADAASVLLTFAGALLEGRHVLAALARHSASFCDWREAVSTLPAETLSALISNARLH